MEGIIAKRADARYLPGRSKSWLKVKCMGATPALDAVPHGADVRGAVWVKPELVVEVAFTEWTQDGRLRHPSFQGVRDDKAAREVKRDRPAS
jgi:ATP-dependent DNA ligase